MNTSTAIKCSCEDIIKLLEASGLIDGEKKSTSSSAIRFWDTELKSKEASDQQTYVVWSLVSTNRKNIADDKSRARNAFATIDIFSRRPITAKPIQNLITALDNAAEGLGWRFEYNGPVGYSKETTIYSIEFDLYKIFN
jgi:hypothetical protein